MFTNHQHHPQLTQEAHRALPYVSNTDLSNLAAELLGQLRGIDNPQALTFGSYFHTAVLEPHLFNPVSLNPDEADRRARQQAYELARSIRRRRYPRHLLYSSRGQVEQTHTATHEATGITVKVRPDLVVDSPKRQRRTLVDFKTTSCTTEEQFRATIEKYGYDRQQALYADVLGATRVLLVAVQKRCRKGQEPAVWVVELSAEQLAAGRKKYGRLLRAHAEQRSNKVLQPEGYPLTLGEPLPPVTPCPSGRSDCPSGCPKCPPQEETEQSAELRARVMAGVGEVVGKQRLLTKLTEQGVFA